ncbi:MAG: uracil-DNA glycosylase family protein [Myxococcota bacterium]
MRLIEIHRQLTSELARLSFGPPVTHVYNPLEYARQPFERYLSTYGTLNAATVLLGMNPGPFGMAQTGVPFGEVASVRDWMGIEAPVQQPKSVHPKRPIKGFECPRSEVSGARLWGWAKARYETPERFFRQFFVLNYCPLVFLEESGRNRTPDKLPQRERLPLLTACDAALQASIEVLQPQRVIGVGLWAQKRAQLALADTKLPIGTVLHPSPASPKANRGWAERAEQDLIRAGCHVRGRPGTP